MREWIFRGDDPVPDFPGAGKYHELEKYLNEL
jgi:hypothetical protein